MNNLLIKFITLISFIVVCGMMLVGMQAQVLAMGLCVGVCWCVCVCVIVSIRRLHGSSWFLADKLPRLILYTVFKEIMVSPKIRVLLKL